MKNRPRLILPFHQSTHGIYDPPLVKKCWPLTPTPQPSKRSTKAGDPSGMGIPAPRNKNFYMGCHPMLS